MANTDTTSEARHVQFDFYRSLSGAERVRIAAQMAEGVRAVAIEGIRNRNPELSDDDVTLEFIRLAHGQVVADQLRMSTPNL